MNQVISNRGLTLIKQFEGLRLRAYDDGGGVWTIGYGHTKNVKSNDVITQDQADEFLKEDIKWAEDTVNAFVNVPLKQNQFDALVSLAFNIGANAFAKSTLLKILNMRHYEDAAKQFIRWSFDNGKFIRGLYKRRLEETNLFLEE